MTPIEMPRRQNKHMTLCNPGKQDSTNKIEHWVATPRIA
jgi:hypothetical protein